MAFVAKATRFVTDNWLGMNPAPQPNQLPPPALTPPNPSISTMAGADRTPASSIVPPRSDSRRGDAMAAGAGGQSGLSLDPLGRRGAGYVPSHKSLLGR